MSAIIKVYNYGLYEFEKFQNSNRGLQVLAYISNLNDKMGEEMKKVLIKIATLDADLREKLLGKGKIFFSPSLFSFRATGI